MAVQTNWHAPWRDRGWLPVAGDGCGNQYVLVSHGIAYVVASDLWTFLRFLLLRETGDGRWPFDRRAVIAADPELAGLPIELKVMLGADSRLSPPITA